MNWYYYFPYSGLVNAVTALGLGLFILSRNYKSSINRGYALFAFAVCFWSFNYFIWLLSKEYNQALLFIRLTMLGPFIIPAAFVYFVTSLLSINRKYLHLGNIVLIIIFFSFSFSPIYIQDVEHRLFFSFWPVPGWMFHIVLAYFIIELLYAQCLLWKEMKKSQGARRNQIKYILLGIFIGFVSGCTNYPLWYNIPIAPYLNIFVSGFVVCVAYAIIRHHLMDIAVVVKKTLVFALLFTIVFGIVVGLTFFIQQLITGGSIIGYILSCAIIILTFHPIENFLINVTNKYLFQKKSDSRQIVGAFIQYAATVLDSDKIVSETIELSEKAFHPQSCAILLSNNGKYIQQGVKDKTSAIFIDNSSVIVAYLKSAKVILSIENENDKRISEEIKNEMFNFKATLAVPLVLQDDLFGIILLGKKKSDEYYSQEDLGMLMDLARTLAIALKNAEFVKERDAMHLEMTQAKLKEELATMAYGMSHQFNNKFQGIAMTVRCAKVLLSKLDLPEELKNKLQAIFDNMAQAEKDALGAGEIAQGLLNFTKPDRLQYGMVNITSNIGIVLQLVEYKHPAFREVEVIKNTEESLPLTYAHLGYLQEAYFIILDNAYEAIEYMKARNIPNFKGRITISASKDRKTKEIVVSIKDNGVGMKPDVLEKVRNAIPFFTTKGSSGKSGHGAGVNMLSKFIDDFHKGRVVYDSTPDEGTTVNVYIPIIEKIKDDDKKEEK